MGKRVKLSSNQRSPMVTAHADVDLAVCVRRTSHPCGRAQCVAHRYYPSPSSSREQVMWHPQ